MANWVFGDSIIVTFTESGPVLSPEKSAMRAFEAAACISDTSGNLLFYSNNIGVWNHLHQPLQGSEGINTVSYSHGSSKPNGCLFLPVSGDTTDTKFWVFISDETDNKLRYSLIDRNLDGGLGGIIASHKNLLVWDKPISEQVTAVKHGNGRDWWIISKEDVWKNQVFLAALFGPGGIEAVVQSDTLLNFAGIGWGEMKANSSGTFIGQVIPDPIDDEVKPFISIYEFNRCTGGFILKDIFFGTANNSQFYSFEFAEADDIAFSGTAYSRRTTQFDFSSGVILDSLFLVVDNNWIGQMELGPDGYIYYVLHYIGAAPPGEINGSQFLWRIGHDSIGNNFYVDSLKVDLKQLNFTYSLPNFANYDLGPLAGSPCDTLSLQTGLNHIPLQHLSWSVWPTTSTGLFTLQSDQAGWMIIHNLFGREVLRQWHEDMTTFDLTAQPSGLYLVHLSAADGTQSLPRKIVRQ